MAHDWSKMPAVETQEVPFTVNQNGNYRRGWQRYVRGGMPKKHERVVGKVVEFSKHCTIPRGWEVLFLEDHDDEFKMLVQEVDNKKVFVHIPKDESIEISFEWDYEG